MSFQRYATHNAVLPKLGPLTYSFNLKWNGITSQDVDLTDEITSEKLDYVSGFYINNVANPNPMKITVAQTGQVIVIPAGKCAYMPTLSAGVAKFTLETTAGDFKTQFYPVNFPCWPCVF